MTTRRTGSTASAASGRSVVHKSAEECPPWCHYCPHMHGHVFPHCYGSACQYDDEDDLMHCTCNPCDPTVTRADLVHRTEVLVRLLRDKRRERRMDRQAVVRILAICRAMNFSRDTYGLVLALKEIESLARRISTAMELPQAVGEVDPHIGETPA